MEPTPRQQKILLLVTQNGLLQSSKILELLLTGGEETSLITIKRELSELTSEGYLQIKGIGRSTAYKISIKGRMFVEINAFEYCKIDPDKRYGLSSYNFELYNSMNNPLFTEAEQAIFDKATVEYKNV